MWQIKDREFISLCGANVVCIKIKILAIILPFGLYVLTQDVQCTF